jgi:hypothetical protein
MHPQEAQNRWGWLPTFDREQFPVSGEQPTANTWQRPDQRQRPQKGRDPMKPPAEMTRIVDRKRYSVQTATLIAADDFWDGHNFERRGRNRFLYRTPGGAYFLVTLTQWQGEQDTLEPMTLEEALELFEGPLTEHAVSYREAFPSVEVVDA